MKGTEGEKLRVCVHFSGSDIPPKNPSNFRSCGTIMVLVELSSTKSTQTAELGVTWDVPFMSKVKTSAGGVCSVPRGLGVPVLQRMFHRLGNPGENALSAALSEASWAALSHGESEFDVAVDLILCLGMQAKAFDRIEELTQSQERLWKLPQQVRH